jgi:hypothetical protein
VSFAPGVGCKLISPLLLARGVPMESFVAQHFVTIEDSTREMPTPKHAKCPLASAEKESQSSTKN